MSKLNPDLFKNFGAKEYKTKPLGYYLDGIILNRDRFILSEAITLLESQLDIHKDLAYEILLQCFEHCSHGLRIGVTGTPGVGKSSFINSYIHAQGGKSGLSAVLTIDPSSSSSKGSILGDKTRMNEIVAQEDIFIRPSPASNHLGGINYNTYEALIMCEAAGMETLFVETVGVGQSETEVSEICDCTLLLVNPGTGDELQAIKKGIFEVADIIIVNKSDGPQLALAKELLMNLESATSFSSRNKLSNVPLILYSALENRGVQEVATAIQAFIANQKESGVFAKKRLEQNKRWLEAKIKDLIYSEARKHIEKSSEASDLFQWKDENESPFAKYLLAKRILKNVFDS